MAESETIAVQVCYALPGSTSMSTVHLPAGSSLAQAIEASGILAQFPELDLAVNRTGIFGKLKTPDTVVREGDRVEIYRALLADPKDARRRRAGQKPKV
jgi:putative ubiquitin-RnfH superfamily antitoxin RatB of RatAB toxin-antitoxin module